MDGSETEGREIQVRRLLATISTRHFCQAEQKLITLIDDWYSSGKRTTLYSKATSALLLMNMQYAITH